jgi:hypothetical protein
MNDAEPYAIDVDAIGKGDTIGPEHLARLIPAPDQYTYQYRLAGFIEWLEAELWRRDKPYSVVYRKGSVLVLDDEEASTYNAKRFDRHRRGMLYNQRRLLAVDPSDFDPDQRRNHLRRVEAQGAILASILATKKRLRAEAYVRNTPAIHTSEIV